MSEIRLEELRARAVERGAVTHLLKLGYGLSLFEELDIWLLDDGETACVVRDSGGDEDYTAVELPLASAVSTFLRLRGEMKLGFDHESVGV